MPKRTNTNRQLQVLGALVKAFLKTGEPVASHVLVKGGNLQCSSATVRSVLAELEDRGFLHQSHPSSGRVPTEQGIRAFIDELPVAAELNREDEAYLAAELPEAGTFRDLLPRVSRLAALFSDCAGVVLVPPMAAERLSRIEILRLRVHEFIAILVTESGAVHHRSVLSPEDYSPAEVERFNHYLNSILDGLTLAQLHERVEEKLHEAREQYDRLAYRALELAGTGLADVAPVEQTVGQVIVDGVPSVLARPEVLGDVRRLKAAMELLQEHGRLATLLSQVVRSRGGKTSTLIGSETGIDNLPVALVVAGYGPDRQQPIGAVAVLGIARMNYERIIPMVGYLANRISGIAQSARLS